MVVQHLLYDSYWRFWRTSLYSKSIHRTIPTVLFYERLIVHSFHTALQHESTKVVISAIQLLNALHCYYQVLQNNAGFCDQNLCDKFEYRIVSYCMTLYCRTAKDIWRLDPYRIMILSSGAVRTTALVLYHMRAPMWLTSRIRLLQIVPIGTIQLEAPQSHTNMQSFSGHLMTFLKCRRMQYAVCVSYKG